MPIPLNSVHGLTGSFSVEYAGAAGGSGGTDGAVTKTVTWRETYAVSWSKYRTGEDRPFFDAGEHQAGPAAIAKYMARANVYWFGLER